MSESVQKPRIRFKGFSDAWEQRKLEDFFTERNERSGNGEMISVTIGSGIKKFDELNRFDKKPDDLSKYKRVEVGDIAYNSMRMWQGASGYSPYSGILSPAYTVITPKNGVSSRFFAYVLKQPKMIHQFEINSQGLTKDTWNLKFPAFAPIEVVAPLQLVEQEKVSELLLQLDNLITLHQRKYDKLVAVKKALLEKMFPADGETVPKIRFKGFSDAWEQRKFEEIAVRSSVICSDDTLPRVEYEDIVSGTGRLNKDIYAKQSSKSGIAFHQGDVLYGKLRPYLQNWLLPTFDGLAVGDFWVLQPQNADSSFLYRLIQSRQFDEVANQSTGTKMPRADWKLVSKTVFSIPSSISEQAAIGTYFTALDSLITLHQRQLEKLKNIKSALLEKMFV